jgi:hypothetical protein
MYHKLRKRGASAPPPGYRVVIAPLSDSAQVDRLICNLLEQRVDARE